MSPDNSETIKREERKEATIPTEERSHGERGKKEAK